MRILVVDDSQLYLSLTKKYLEEMPNINEVILSSNPLDVVAIVEEEKIDIVILDVIMPGISGYEILKKLREDKKHNDIPIIMLTSLNDDESYKKCYDLGATDYINKPINEIEFRARLKVAIESKVSSNNLKELFQVAQQQNRELKEMNAKLNDTKFHLVQSEKMAAIGQLSAGIAHEINNPMGFVSSNFEILMKYFNRLSEYITFINKEYASSNITDGISCPVSINRMIEKYKNLKIDMILTELGGILSDSEVGIQRVTEIIQSLRMFARSVKDDEKDTYSLLDIIKQVILITKNEVKYVAETTIEVPDDLILYCNKVQLGQVFINILVNASQAIKYQNRNELGLIQIIAEKKEPYIIIHFIDNGPGIPTENKLKVFDPFFTTKEIGQGTGLGLSISYDIIVNKHQGMIDFFSEPGKGTDFVVKLPIATTV